MSALVLPPQIPAAEGHDLFAKALDQRLPTEQAVQQVHETVEQFSQEVEVERAKFNETVSYAEGIQAEIETKIREGIGNEDTEKIKKGEAVSKEKYLQDRLKLQKTVCETK